MLYVKINEQGLPLERPITKRAMQERLPNVMLAEDPSDEILRTLGFACVPEADLPPRREGHATVLGIPEVDSNGKMVRTYEYIPYTEEGLEIRKNELRADRDKLLAASDWTQSADVQATMSPVQQQEWSEYRAALRNITEDFADPKLAVYPEVPSEDFAKVDTKDPKAKAKRTIQALFTEARQEGLSYQFPDGLTGNIQLRDPTDLVNLLGIAIRVILAKETSQEFSTSFRDAQNNTHALNASEALLLVLSAFNYMISLYERKWTSEAKIEANQADSAEAAWSE